MHPDPVGPRQPAALRVAQRGPAEQHQRCPGAGPPAVLALDDETPQRDAAQHGAGTEPDAADPGRVADRVHTAGAGRVRCLVSAQLAVRGEGATGRPLGGHVQRGTQPRRGGRARDTPAPPADDDARDVRCGAVRRCAQRGAHTGSPARSGTRRGMPSGAGAAGVAAPSVGGCAGARSGSPGAARGSARKTRTVAPMSMTPHPRVPGRGRARHRAKAQDPSCTPGRGTAVRCRGSPPDGRLPQVARV